MASISVALMDTPLLTCKEFGERIGKTEDAVRRAAQRGVWPTVKMGGNVYINLLAICDEAKTSANKWGDLHVTFNS